MSLGILGGTFNPIHRAHLRLGEVARIELGLARVLFVVAGDPPLKRSQVAPAHHRLAMVALALAHQAHFEVSDLELRRAGRSYTVDTLSALRRQHPGEALWFLLGADSLAQLDEWYAPERLFELASFAVVQRPGTAAGLEVLVPRRLAEGFEPETDACWRHRSGHELRVLPFDPLDVSATEVRRRVMRGRPIDDLVPQEVAAYIAEHQLYQEAA